MPKKTAKSKSSYRIYFWLFAVVVIIFLALKFFSLYKSSIFLSDPWRKTIVFYTDPLVLITFAQSDDDQDVVITVPLDITATVPYGYGQYRLEAVKRLGEIEKKPELLMQTIEDMFGIKIETWISRTQNAHLLKDKEQTMLSLVKQNASSLIFANDSATSLHILDRFILFIKLINLKSQNALTYDLEYEAYHLVDPGVLPDGSPIRTVNEYAFDQLFEHTFEEPGAGLSGFSVQVLNATQTFGIGQRFARLLNTAGFKVTQIGNADKETHNSCLIKANTQHAQSSMVLFIAQRFGCEISVVNEGLATDAIVVVGNSYSQRWGFKN